MDRQNVCFGFIGTGNMGSALARAVRRRLDGSQILLANQTMEKASRLAEELDAGDTILTLTTPVWENETSGELYKRLAPLGADCLAQTLELFAQGRPVPRTPQEHSRMSLAPMLEKSMGELDFTGSATALHNRIRGLNPWPCAWTTVGGKRLKVLRSVVAERLGSQGKPGEVLSHPGDEFVVACGQGSLVLTEVQLEGKKAMAGATYLAGARLSGELLG